MIESLPDISLLEQNLRTYVQAQQDEASDKFSVAFKNLDQRIVTMRKEFDVDSIVSLVRKKADAEQVNADLKTMSSRSVCLTRT